MPAHSEWYVNLLVDRHCPDRPTQISALEPVDPQLSDYSFATMSPVTPAIAKRRMDALWACAANPQGLRGNAYPSAMPVLEAQGLVARRTGGRVGRASYWFLTPAGRELLAKGSK